MEARCEHASLVYRDGKLFKIIVGFEWDQGRGLGATRSAMGKATEEE
jgi:hypothetical protein